MLRSFSFDKNELKMLQPYAKGIQALKENSYKDAIVNFKETIKIFESFGTDNLSVQETLLSLKYKELLCWFSLRDFRKCLNLLQKIKILLENILEVIK